MPILLIYILLFISPIIYFIFCIPARLPSILYSLHAIPSDLSPYTAYPLSCIHYSVYSIPHSHCPPTLMIFTLFYICSPEYFIINNYLSFYITDFYSNPTIQYLRFPSIYILLYFSTLLYPFIYRTFYSKYLVPKFCYVCSVL
jgi:hypothetical protein